MSKLLAFLLHYANADPPLVTRREFYALKDRLLERYGTHDGNDVQEIAKECWGHYRDDGCCGKTCERCCGTGIFETVYVLLRRYRWGRYTFHRPIDRSWVVPSFFGPPTIHGRIRHADYGRASAEATLWLYVLTGEWALLWRALGGTRRYGWWRWTLSSGQSHQP